MNRLTLLLTAATLAAGVSPLRAAAVVDLNIIPSDLLQRENVVTSGPPRDDPVVLAQRRGDLERLKNEQGRAGLLASTIERERAKWQAMAPHIGLSPAELERFLLAQAESELQWNQKSLECLVDLACNWNVQPESRRDSDAELLRLLGNDKHVRYKAYINANSERWYVQEMRRRLPPDDPLSDAQAERIALVLAEERERLVAEAARQGFTASGPAYSSSTLQLYGIAKEGAPDESATRRVSAASYARRLVDRVSSLLSRSQLAGFKEMLDRNLAVYDERMRENEIMAAARTSSTGGANASNLKTPEMLALARYRLERLREPGNYKSEAVRLDAQVRYDWYQRAIVAGVSSRNYDQLVLALSTAELQNQERLLECDADPVCSRPPENAHRAALDNQAARVVGADRFATMQAYEDAHKERSYVTALRSALPPELALTDLAAVKLVMALASERERIVQSAKQDGLEVDVALEFLSTWRPGSTGTDKVAQRLASATDSARRLHDVAAGFLDKEQLRHFDAIHQRTATEWQKHAYEAAERQKWARDAAAQPPQ